MIPIMFCFNNNYAMPAAAALYSLLENSSKQEEYKLHVVHSDITLANQKKLKETIQSFEFASLEFIDIQGRFDKIFKMLPFKNFSADLFAKLIPSSLFPQYDKIMISDVDVIFLRDVAPLFHGYTDNTYLCRPNCSFIKKHIPKQYPEGILENYTEYEQEMITLHQIGAGFMIYNLDAMRKDNFEETVLQLLEKHAQHLYLPEQEILTLACHGHTSPLPDHALTFFHTKAYSPFEDPDFLDKFDYEQAKKAIENTIQWHYIGHYKPWIYHDAYMGEEFYKYIVKTPFAHEFFQEMANKNFYYKMKTLFTFKIPFSRYTFTLIKSKIKKPKVPQSAIP